MPSDVSVELVSHATAQPPRRMPVGIGLTIGACASVGLWTVIGFGLRALFT